MLNLANYAKYIMSSQLNLACPHIILDSSDCNPRFYDLMLAGESQRAYHNENMEFPGISWYRSLAYLLNH